MKVHLNEYQKEGLKNLIRNAFGQDNLNIPSSLVLKVFEDYEIGDTEGQTFGSSYISKLPLRIRQDIIFKSLCLWYYNSKDVDQLFLLSSSLIWNGIDSAQNYYFLNSLVQLLRSFRIDFVLDPESNPRYYRFIFSASFDQSIEFFLDENTENFKVVISDFLIQRAIKFNPMTEPYKIQPIIDVLKYEFIGELFSWKKSDYNLYSEFDNQHQTWIFAFSNLVFKKYGY